MFGEYIKPGIRSLPPGSPKPASPYLPPKPETKIPSGMEWVRDLTDELIRKVFKRTMKVMTPYHYFPPFYHTPVDMLEPVQVNMGATETIIELTIPQGQMLRIKFYGQDITAVPPAVLPGTEWAEVVWTFSVNGVPLEHYDAFLGQRGAVIWPAETTIVLDGSDVFRVTAENTSAANNYFVWASIRGWQWSKLSTPLPDADMLED